MNLLESPRRRAVLFTLLYFSEGAPIGFVWWALPTMMRMTGAPVGRITTLVSLLVLPWALKFLWAPLIDIGRGPRLGFRGWIAASQVAMILALLPLLGSGLQASFTLIAAALFAHAVAAATQDAAIDGLVIRSSTPQERGRLNGWMQAGMLLGRSLFGGGALLLRDRVGDEAVLLALVSTLGVTLSLAFLYREAEDPRRSGSPGAGAELVRHLGAVITSRTCWLGLAFAAVGGAAFEGVGAVAGPFLLDHGASAAMVGSFFAFPSAGLMALGALAGGFAADGLGRRVAVAAFQIFVALVGLALALCHSADVTVLLALLAALYFGIGLFTAASYALFMDLTDPTLGATQFSAFMGATNLCEAWAAFTVGRAVESVGYGPAFTLMVVLSCLALPLLAGMRPRDR